MERIVALENHLSFRTVVILGNFDGVHLGHVLLFEKAKEIAKEENLKTVVFTFEPHPASVLSNQTQFELIYTRDEKFKCIAAQGVDVLVEFPFSLETAQIKPREFIKDILISKLNVSSIVVGSDFRFGKEKQGDYKLLVDYSEEYDFDVHVIHKLKRNYKEVSSSWIRDLIREGNLEQANALLGSPFLISGIVQHGKQIGREIGYPTANINPPKNKLLPPHGVYSVQVKCQDKLYTGITNIGYKPTVNGNEITVETHILDFDLDIYGVEITVWFHHFIRAEKKFSGLEELKKQIHDDISNVSL